MRPGADLAIGPGLKEEELDFGCGLVGVTHFGCSGQGLLEHVPRIAGKRCTIGRVDIADDARGRQGLRLPGQHGKCRQVGHQVHVALGDARKPLDRRAVEPDAVIDCHTPLRDGDGDLFDNSDDVAELQIDEAYVLPGYQLVYAFQLSRVMRHAAYPPR